MNKSFNNGFSFPIKVEFLVSGRSTSWRGEGDSDDKSVVPDRGGRSGWNDNTRTTPGRRSWDTEDHLPEWATENPTDGGGSFDDKGAFHGSDDEQVNNQSRFELFS